MKFCDRFYKKTVLSVTILFAFLLSFAVYGQNANIDSLNLEIKKTTNDSTKVMLMDKIVWNYLFTNTDTALVLARKEYAYVQKKNVKTMLGWSLNTLASCFNISEQYDSAIVYYKKSLAVKREKNDQKGISTSLSNLGTCYQRKSAYNKALECYMESYNICEKLNLNENKLTLGSNIAQLQVSMGFYRECLRTCQKNTILAKELNRALELANSTLLMAGAYQSLKKVDSSVACYLKSISYYKTAGDEIGLAGANTNLGTLYLDTREFKKAQMHFLEADKLFEKFDANAQRAVSQEGLGLCYESNGNTEEAIKCFKKSYEFAKASNNMGVLNSTTAHLFDTYNKIKNYKEAVNYLLLHNSYADSIRRSSDKTEYVKKMYEFEFEKEKTASKNEKQQIELKAYEAKKRQNLIITGITFVLIISLVFIWLIYKGLIKNRKATEIIKLQKQEVEEKNILIETKQNEILDSIKYAKRIQYTLLANKKLLSKHLSDYFILFKPKDLVSGDFYWAMENDHLFYFAVCDSTGHGVPGAFMSLLNSNYLTEAIREKGIKEPNKIFDYVRERLIENVSLDGARDGMDAVLICWDKLKNRITYAAANNSPVLIKNGSLHVLSMDKMPIGKGEKNDHFKLFELDINNGDCFYIYTDGFADQFGGPKGKKFKYKQLNQLILDNYQKTMQEQRKTLEETLDDWKKDLEQIDDVCVFGLKF